MAEAECLQCHFFMNDINTMSRDNTNAKDISAAKKSRSVIAGRGLVTAHEMADASGLPIAVVADKLQRDGYVLIRRALRSSEVMQVQRPD